MYLPYSSLVPQTMSHQCLRDNRSMITTKISRGKSLEKHPATLLMMYWHAVWLQICDA